MERSVCKNNQCFKQLPAKTEKFRNSFFVRTTHDWNILSDNIVNCDTVESFRTLIAKKKTKFVRSTPLNKSQDWLLQRTIQIQIKLLFYHICNTEPVTVLNPGIGKPYTTVIFRRFGPCPFGYCRMYGRIRFGYSF